MKTVKKVVNLYHVKLGIKNVQIINSSGVEAQQDIFHIHFHIVPRSFGDNQDIKWITHKEWRDKFGDLLNKLKAGVALVTMRVMSTTSNTAMRLDCG